MVVRMLSFVLSSVSSVKVASAGASLWSDNNSIAGDRERLSQGSNLIYVAAGSEDFLSSTLKSVTSAFQGSDSEEHYESSVHLHCMNIVEGAIRSPIGRLLEYTESTGTTCKGSIGSNNCKSRDDVDANKINILAVNNVEKIEVTELKRLDFLFRVTDQSYDKANIVVLLLWNTDVRPFTAEEKREFRVMRDEYGDNYSDNDADDEDKGEDKSSDENENEGEEGEEIELKGFLAAEWTKGGPLVNGNALVGRMARTVHNAKHPVLTESDPDGSVLSEESGDILPSKPLKTEKTVKTDSAHIKETKETSTIPEFCLSLKDEMKTIAGEKEQMEIQNKNNNKNKMTVDGDGPWILLSQQLSQQLSQHFHHFYSFYTYESGFPVYLISVFLFVILYLSYQGYVKGNSEGNDDIVGENSEDRELRASERRTEDNRMAFLKMVIFTSGSRVQKGVKGVKGVVRESAQVVDLVSSEEDEQVEEEGVEDEGEEEEDVEHWKQENKKEKKENGSAKKAIKETQKEVQQEVQEETENVVVKRGRAAKPVMSAAPSSKRVHNTRSRPRHTI